MGLLTGLTVVEHSQYISAPFCAKLLGDLRLGYETLRQLNPRRP